ncbi:MAG: 5-formyltetrahydrofolate cyclo-ligase [Spirulina sp. SIO3F2]|nr:5-formyltetrahydrofolate cyclo-ligase [Spirulina sp. SIO3F2]
MVSKAAWRQNLLQQRQNLHPETWRTWSDRLCAHLVMTPLVQQAQIILAYWPLRQEPDLTPLLTDYPKCWGLPRCVGKRLVWHEWQPGDRLHKGKYGLQEPNPDAPVLAANAVDLLLIPAVGCDRVGYRLGYGGGYYDRLFADPAWRAIPAIGITFEFAHMEALPHDPWDQPLNGICTEAGFFAV